MRAAEPKSGAHLARPSYYQYMIHQQDALRNQGFDYETKLFERILSPYMLVDPRKSLVLDYFQKMAVYLINATGNIKKAFNYTVDKNYRVHS
jgi:hypothetical protein